MYWRPAGSGGIVPTAGCLPREWTQDHGCRRGQRRRCLQLGYKRLASIKILFVPTHSFCKILKGHPCYTWFYNRSRGVELVENGRQIVSYKSTNRISLPGARLPLSRRAAFSSHAHGHPRRRPGERGLPNITVCPHRILRNIVQGIIAQDPCMTATRFIPTSGCVFISWTKHPALPASFVQVFLSRPAWTVAIMLTTNLQYVSLLLAAGVAGTSAQALPVIDLGTSVHRAQLNVSGPVEKS